MHGEKTNQLYFLYGKENNLNLIYKVLGIEYEDYDIKPIREILIQQINGLKKLPS